MFNEEESCKIMFKLIKQAFIVFLRFSGSLT